MARGFLGFYRELIVDWFKSIHRQGFSLGTNLKRKVLWSSRNHQVQTSVEQRQRMFGSVLSDKNMG